MMEEEEETLFDQEGLLGGKDVSVVEVTEKKKKLLKTAALSMSFFSMGLCVAIAGTTLPDLGNQVSKDTEHMTFILVARAIGYLLGAGVGGILSDFYDQQLILFYVLLFTSIATVAAPWCTTLFFLALMIGVQGTALGVLDTGGNLFCIRLWKKKSAPYMQFLHFAFGVGAFIAPLIARPFLSDSITEYSSNTSYKGLFYSSFNHSVGTRTGRDLSHVLNLVDQSKLLLDRWKRDEEVILNGTSNIFESYNSSATLPTPTTIRPKKPEKVNSKPLSGANADAENVKDRLKNLKDNPATDDEEEEAKRKLEDSSKTTQNPEKMNSSESMVNTSSSVNSEKNVTSGIADEDEKTLSTSTASTVTTSTSSTSTSTTVSTSSATTSSTLSTAGRSDDALIDDSDLSILKPENAKDKLSTSESPSVGIHNTTEADKGESSLLDQIIIIGREMSKIQFAYLIVGLCLFVNAFYFVSLFYKDGIRCSHRPEPSHEELVRSPDPKSFVVSILVLLFLFFYFYVGMEQTFGILLTTFAVEYPQTIWTPTQAATIIAVFWGCVALGRGLSILMAHFFKPPCMMVLNLCLIVTASVLLSFTIKTAWFMLWLGTAILGLGMSSVFATTISWADSYYPLSGKATAVFVAGSGFGQMTIPVMTGYLYQNVDRMCLMYVVFGACCALSVIYTSLQCVASWRGTLGSSRSRSGFMMLGTAEDAGDSLDMDLIQAGGMGGSMSNDRVRHQKHNGISGDDDDTETTQLVELSD